MAVPAVTITRDVMNQYGKAGITDASKPSGLWIQPLVKDFIPIMSWLGTPMADAIGKAAGTTDQVVLRFGEGDVLPRTTNVNGAIADGIDTTIVVDDASIFQKYEEVLVPSTGEHLWLTAGPDTATQTITVQRGFASSAGAAIADNAELIRLGPTVPEGVDAPDSPRALGNTDENYCGIVEYTWKNSHRSRVTPDEEVKSDRFKYEQTKKMKEAALDLEYKFLYGLKNEGDGSGANPSTFGGLREFTTAHANPVSGALELLDIMNGLEDVATDVGPGEMGKTLMLSFRASRIFNSFFRGQRRYTGSGDISLTEDGFDCDFGHFKKAINHRMPDDEIYLWNPADVKRFWFEGGMWSTGLYSTQGWYDKGFLRADLGVMWTGDRRRAKWTGFDTADGSYPNLDKFAVST